MKTHLKSTSSLVNFIVDGETSIAVIQDKARQTYTEQLLTTEFWEDLLKKFISLTYNKFVHHELVERFVVGNNNDIVKAFAAYKGFLESQPTAEKVLREIVADASVHEFSDIDALVNDALPRFKYTKEGFQITRRLHNEFFKKAHRISQQQLELIDELLSEFLDDNGESSTNRDAVMEFYNKMRKIDAQTSKNLTDEVVVDIIQYTNRG